MIFRRVGEVEAGCQVSGARPAVILNINKSSTQTTSDPTFCKQQLKPNT
jgi:hypothetical protein